MASWPARFAAGDRIESWAEVRRLGPVPQQFHDEVEELAALTMRQARRQLDRIAEQLLVLGLRPAYVDLLIGGPSSDAAEQVAALATSLGPVPAALAASFVHIGSVSFVGDCAELGLYYNDASSALSSAMPPGPKFPDPLVLPDVEQLVDEWAEGGQGEKSPDDVFVFPFCSRRTSQGEHQRKHA